MKRFWKEARAAATEGGWRVELDGRAVKTQGGKAQVVPSPALAEALAGEWNAQGADIDAAAFVLRDLADHAIDSVSPDREGTIATLLRYAETDTLCYRAEPGDALLARQDAVWEPLLKAAEARWDVHFTRIGGVIHQPQPDATLARLRKVLEAQDHFTLAALTTLAALAASLVVALAAIEPGADPLALWDAANLEEDWQAELWGNDPEAEHRRARRLAAFQSAAQFARLAQD